MQNSFSGSAKITDAGIKKHFKNFEAEKAIFELVWNGLDAKATAVDIKIKRNTLKGLESVTIFDNGDGIDFKNIENNFGKFNESLKNNDSDKHGSHGRGRLAFHKLCNKAIWYTKFNSESVKITIDSASIKDFEGDYLQKSDQHKLLAPIKSGTCVELINFNNHDLTNEEELKKSLGIEFGWFLALNKSHRVSLNGEFIEIPENELHEDTFKINGISFNVKVFRWNDKPSSEKSYNYLVNSDNKIVDKKLSRFNKKINFYTTAYVFSEWIDKFDPDGLGVIPENTKYSEEYNELTKKLLNYQTDIYYEFLRSYVDEKIQSYDDDGYFPSYEGVHPVYAKWRKQHTKAVVKEIYLSDPSIFNTLNIRQLKILIRLLDKILVSNENDSLFEVLDSVLDLDSKTTERFAAHLKKTTLDNIVSTIETLQKREHAIHKLREVMEKHYKNVLETPDLQKIIEANTWLFGDQYTLLGAEEDSFQSTAKNLRDTVKDISIINDDDIAEGASLDGVNRQVDLFLARKKPSHDFQGNPYYKCVIIEIKRPGISLNKKHLRQLEDYAEIISKNPSFNSDRLKFELILIGRKISITDTQIKSKLEGLKDKGEVGLVSSDSKIKSYVKTWFTIFDDFELSNDYLLSTLNTKLESLSTVTESELVSDLQKANN